MQCLRLWSVGLRTALAYIAVGLSVGPRTTFADPPAGVIADELLPPVTGQSADFALRRAGVEVGASYRIEVSQEGLYRVTWTQLTQAGVSPSMLIGDQLRLFCRTQEVALLPTTQGLFGQSDSFLFYGQGWNGVWSRTNVYWLGFGGISRQMPQTAGTVLGGGADVTSHWQTVVCATKRRYNAFYRASDGSMDHWFFTNINTSGDAIVQVNTEGRMTGGTARLEVVLDGLYDQSGVDPDHCTRVTIGGVVTTSFLHEALNAYTGTVEFAAARLSDGVTTLAFRGTNLSSTYDWSLLRWLAISYTRALRVAGGGVTFDGETGSRNYIVTGLVSSTGFRLLDVTDPACPTAITGVVAEAHGSGFRVRFGRDSSLVPRFHLAEATRVLTPARIVGTTFRGLGGTARSAEWVAVCPYAFRDSAYALVKHRYKQGTKVAVAPIEDIYNEFGYGIADPAALKQFIGYAYHHWTAPRLRYVCLMGEGTYDPMDNLGTHAANWIPVYMGPSAFMWTSQDNWFAQVDGDDMLPDVAIGRIPVATSQQLRDVVTKIVAFEADTNTNNTWRTRATLVADNVDGASNFKQVTTNNVRPYLTGFSLSEQYLLDPDPADNIRTALRNTINGGRYFVSYFGHGAYDRWADENLWNTTDVAGLTNTKYPIVAMFTCKSGAMHDPTAECLAEVFVEQSGKGAVAAVVSTDLTVLQSSAYFADGFTKALARTKVRRLGDALLGGLGALSAASPEAPELNTFEVVGDPGQVVNP
jgi:hypothetical protein